MRIFGKSFWFVSVAGLCIALSATMGGRDSPDFARDIGADLSD